MTTLTTYKKTETRANRPYEAGANHPAHLPASGVPNSTLVAMLGELSGTEKELPQFMKQRLDERFGVPLQGLKIYEDEGLQELGQRGYAKGNEIHLAQGEFAPNTESGRELLFHEAGHVIQQGSGLARSSGILENPALEAQASIDMPAPDSFQMPSSAEGAVQGWNPFAKRRRSHQDAIDQILDAKRDGTWKATSKAKRAAWTMLNPLAAIRSHTKSGKQGAEERQEERTAAQDMRERMEDPTYQSGGDFASKVKPSTAAVPSEPGTSAQVPDEQDESMSTDEKIARVNDKLGERADEAWSAATVGSSPLDTVSAALPKVDALSTVSSSLGVGINALGMVNSGSAMLSDLSAGTESKRQGDVTGVRSSGLSAAQNAAYTLGAGVSMMDAVTALGGVSKAASAGLGAAGGVVNTVAGGLQVGKGAYDIHTARKQKAGMAAAKAELDEEDALSEDEQKMYRAFTMGERNAGVQKMQGAFNVAVGGLNVASGVLGTAAALGGATPITGAASAALGGAAVVTDIAGRIATDRKKTKMRERTLQDEGFDLERAIEEYREQKVSEGNKKPSYKHAKRMVLISSGVLSGSRTEAHSNVADRRADLLADTIGSGDTTGRVPDGRARKMGMIAENAVRSMGLRAVRGEDGRLGYNREAIAKKLGGGETKEHRDQMKRKNWGSSLIK